MKTGDRFGLISFFIGAAAASMVPLGARSSHDKPRERSWRSGGYNVAHQGDRERARRRRQIACGQLREQNGLERQVQR